MQFERERPVHAPVQVHSFTAFNTINTVQVYGGTDAREAFAALQAQVDRFERLFSHTLPESSLTRVNQAGGALVEVEPELAELVTAALRYCEATDGLFDITVGPLVELWSAAKQSGTLPSSESLQEARAHVDWHGVHVAGSTIQLEDPQARLVLGGIAKGYVADRLCSLLQQHGVGHAFVNLGGNVKAFGGKPGEGDAPTPFVVGLRVPQQNPLPDNAFAHVHLASGSVVTSGIYERGFKTSDGVFHHHILDPRTGHPSETDIVSASLISETSLDGDGYTTALVVMGLDRALDFVEALPGCEAVFVARDKQVYATSGMGTAIPFELGE